MMGNKGVGTGFGSSSQPWEEGRTRVSVPDPPPLNEKKNPATHAMPLNVVLVDEFEMSRCDADVGVL